ncbi:hypothetical protein [Acaryochloris marina]|uniref:Uncharacterized protein n=1 Tax=Acaryochloris marina (strain MBIC 11017) TaxID=329726 RepID=A8ZP90_ACAM1|nr:hypothetical protein [Acaryochloris marina]ABW32826.1 hypothetical protein AM1_E0056 [Acaryochloris marina MBIC11017]
MDNSQTILDLLSQMQATADDIKRTCQETRERLGQQRRSIHDQVQETLDRYPLL